MSTELGAELFFALFLGLVGVVFAVGTPESKSEAKWRSATLAFCGILALLMICWLALKLVEGVCT